MITPPPGAGGTLVRMPSTESPDPLAERLLPETLLVSIRERAAALDEGNAFPDDDLRQLAETGYLRALVPEDLGGGGLSLLEMCRLQRRLAAAAPATALAIGMHQAWAGIVRVMRARGNASLDWIGREIAAGEVYALGISEAGNDAVLFDSTVRAEPDGQGGYRFHGEKIFTSLAPAWTRLGVFGRDEAGTDGPRLVHGVLRREDGGYELRDDWDALGMRATQSRTTKLLGAHVPAARMVASLPAGPNAEPFVFAVFSNFLLLVASCYLGVSDRVIQIAAQAASQRVSRSQGGLRFSDDPQVRDVIAEMGMRQLAASVLCEATARDVDEHAEHGASWFPRFTGAKYHAARAARRNVEAAFEIAGGAAYQRGHELARLSRDAFASIFHPSQDRSVRRGYANWLLGPIAPADVRPADPAEQAGESGDEA